MDASLAGPGPGGGVSDSKDRLAGVAMESAPALRGQDVAGALVAGGGAPATLPRTGTHPTGTPGAFTPAATPTAFAPAPR